MLVLAAKTIAGEHNFWTRKRRKCSNKKGRRKPLTYIFAIHCGSNICMYVAIPFSVVLSTFHTTLDAY